MRQPTPPEELYRYHTAALDPLVTFLPIHPDAQCGWYKRRIVKGGPWLPARIWMEQPIDAETGELTGDEILHCEVAGKERDADNEWMFLCTGAIPESEYRYMTAMAEWSRQQPREWESPPEPARRLKMKDIPRLFP